MAIKRYEVSHGQWARIAPLLRKVEGLGRTAADNRVSQCEVVGAAFGKGSLTGAAIMWVGIGSLRRPSGPSQASRREARS